MMEIMMIGKVATNKYMTINLARMLYFEPINFEMTGILDAPPFMSTPSASVASRTISCMQYRPEWAS
jgi:hypothetical protein